MTDRHRNVLLVMGAAAGLTVSSWLPASEVDAADRPAERPRGKPNFIVIFVDDLGFNDLGCYAAKNPAIETPHLDRMAAEGIRFTDWLSACSVCAPSRAALLTGRYPQRCGLPICPNPNMRDDFRRNVGLQASEITIASLLRPLGYATAMYGKSHLGFEPRFYPLRLGFDEYYGSLGNFPVGGSCPVLEGDEVVEPKVRYQEIHQRLTDRTIGFMERSKAAGKPFFIYLAHYLVHGPWEPNRRFATDEEWAASQRAGGSKQDGGHGAYPAMVRELDWHVGEVLAALKRLDLDDDTFVIFISDNGPWLPAGSAWPLRGSKYNTFEGGQRVPAIARWPGRIAPGQVCDKLCSTLDVFPTIAALAGAKLPADRVIDGLNLWPVMAGDPHAEAHDVLYYYNGITLEGVRQGKWKLHLPRQPQMRVYWAKGRLGGLAALDEPVLYDLAEEIGEQTDVARQHPEVVSRLLELAGEARSELGDWNRPGRDRKGLLNYRGHPNEQPPRR